MIERPVSGGNATSLSTWPIVYIVCSVLIVTMIVGYFAKRTHKAYRRRVTDTPPVGPAVDISGNHCYLMLWFRTNHSPVCMYCLGLATIEDAPLITNVYVPPNQQ